MKTYRIKIPAYVWWIAGTLVVLTLMYSLWVYYTDGSIVKSISFLGLYFFIGLMMYKSSRKGGVTLSDKNVVSDGNFPIKVETIQSIEEHKTKGFRINYLFENSDRRYSLLLHEEDRQRFLSDLLQINPNIKIG